MIREKVFMNLAGNWLLIRLFKDHGKIIGNAEGQVTMIFDGASKLRYREEVSVKFVKRSMINAYREYSYIYNNNDLISKEFVDGARFYDLAFNIDNSKANGIHLCGEDKYLANYEFSADNRFTLKYEIYGPSKNCLINSEFTKI